MTSIGFFTNQSPFYCHIKKMLLLTKPAKMFVCCRFSNGNHNYSYTFEVDNDVDDGTKDNEDDQGVNLSMVKMARTILF